jgi:hypothetical protein
MEKMALALAEIRPGSRSGTPPILSSPRLLAAATWHAPSNLAACKSMMAYGPTQQQQSQVNWEQMHKMFQFHLEESSIFLDSQSYFITSTR